MIIYIIGAYCIFHVILGDVALLSSVIQKDQSEPGVKAKVTFMNIGFLAVAAWCFK